MQYLLSPFKIVCTKIILLYIISLIISVHVLLVVLKLGILFL